MARNWNVLLAARKVRMDEFRLLFGSRTATQRISFAARRALGLALLLALPAGAQNSPPQVQQPSPGHMGQMTANATVEFDQPDPIGEQHRQRLLNADRQKALVTDVDKLLKLVSKFNAEIGAVNPDTLTPAQLRTLGEIQKLAHSVKTRMSDPVYGTPVFMEPLPLPQNRP
jgi:hypothetical protein